MSKNLIYIVSINDPNTKVSVDDYFQYCLSTWKHYCNHHGIDLKICNEHHFDSSYKPIWNKELIYELGRGYDKIGLIDSDTMIHWDAPNIFDLIDDGLYGVNDLADLNWLFDSIDKRQQFFSSVNLDIFKYVNAGVLFFTNDYLYIFKELLERYRASKEVVDAIRGGGKEQTLLNFLLQEKNVPITLLDPAWNLLSIHKKNMFLNNWQLHPEFNGNVKHNEPDSFPYFMKYANIWHFTGFPIEERVRIMSITWDLIKENYKI